MGLHYSRRHQIRKKKINAADIHSLYAALVYFALKSPTDY
jgi:hypothetical protein